MIEYLTLTILGLVLLVYGNMAKLLGWYLFGCFIMMVAGGYLAYVSTYALLQLAGAIQTLFGLISMLYIIR